MPGDAMAFDQGDEILRAVSAQRRFGEMRIGRQIAIRRGVDIGEIAAPAARNQDLLARFISPLDQQHPPPALAGKRRAQEPPPPPRRE